MKTSKILFLFIFFFCYQCFAQTVDELLNKADEMYMQAKSVSDFDPLIKFLKDAEYNNKNNYEFTWRTGRALSDKAVILLFSFLSNNMNNRKITDISDILDSDKDLESSQEKQLLELGKEARYYMDKAKTLNTSRVETFYYNALAISMYGLGKSIVSALLEGISGKYEDALENSIKLDKSYVEGGALRLFGRYYYVLPWPKRDLKESEKYLRQSVQIGPNNIINHLYLGDLLWKRDNNDEAKKVWREAASLPKSTGFDRLIYDYAKNMLSKRLSLN